MQREKPSRVAAVSLYSALSIYRSEDQQQLSCRQNQSIWSSSLAKHTGYREEDIHQMSKDLLSFIKKIEQS